MRTDLPDVNVLVALHDPDHEFHARAHDWLRQTPSFATTPLSESGLVRLLCNPQVFDPALAPLAALEVLRTLRAHPKAVFWPDPTSLAAPMIRVAAMSGPAQITDMHLLNLAVSMGGRLVTFDHKLVAPLTRRERQAVRPV